MGSLVMVSWGRAGGNGAHSTLKREWSVLAFSEMVFNERGVESTAAGAASAPKKRWDRGSKRYMTGSILIDAHP